MIIHPTPHIHDGVLKNGLHVSRQASMTQIPKKDGTNGRPALPLSAILAIHHARLVFFLLVVAFVGGVVVGHGLVVVAFVGVVGMAHVFLAGLGEGRVLFWEFGVYVGHGPMGGAAIAAAAAAAGMNWCLGAVGGGS